MDSTVLEKVLLVAQRSGNILGVSAFCLSPTRRQRSLCLHYIVVQGLEEREKGQVYC